MLLYRPFLTVTPTVDGDVFGVLAHADAAFPYSSKNLHCPCSMMVGRVGLEPTTHGL